MQEFESAKEFETYRRNLAADLWFKDSKAKVTLHTKDPDLWVVDFQIPGHQKYHAVRVIYLDDYVYISGDFGCVTMDVPWKPKDDSWFASMSYLMEKVKSSTYDKYNFEPSVCKKRIDRILERQKKNTAFAKKLKAAKTAADISQSTAEYASALNKLNLSPDESWVYDAGSVISDNLIAVFTALRLISEQLSASATEEGDN